MCFVLSCLWEIASLGKPICVLVLYCLSVGNCVIGKPKFNKISVFHLGDSSRERPSQKSLNLLNLILTTVQRNASIGISVNLTDFYFS